MRAGKLKFKKTISEMGIADINRLTSNAEILRMNNSQPAEVTTSTIIDGLVQIGLQPTCHLMIHASLSKFGHVRGGPQTVVDAIREIAGEKGAVLIPSFRDAIRSDYYALQECKAQCPQDFCPSHERGYTGILGETVRQQPDALRSCHPTHSWVGIGAAAGQLLSGHRHSPTPCGKDSPFFRLLEVDGTILLLGVPVNSITNFHAVEDVRNVSYLSAIDPAHRHATYTTSGRRIQYRYPEMLHDIFLKAGMIRTVQIGAATCLAISVRQFASLLWIATTDDPWCLVLRPHGNVYDPEQDARLKTAQMLAAWETNPDGTAWKQLLEQSHQAIKPVIFEPSKEIQTTCPAYRGVIRDYHRCAANDLPPWESFEQFIADEPGVATCEHCNWRG